MQHNEPIKTVVKAKLSKISREFPSTKTKMMPRGLQIVSRRVDLRKMYSIWFYLDAVDFSYLFISLWFVWERRF